MIIDKDKLISLLSEKTGSDPDDVAMQLSQLIYRIRSAAADGKSFEIEGLGTFSLKNDQLQFNPDDVLETEINNKYTGMKPIELISAFKGADVETGDVEIPVDPAPAEMPKTEAEIEKEKWIFDEDSATEQERLERAIFGKTFNDDDKKPEPEKLFEAVEKTPPVEPVIRKKEAASASDEDTIGKVLTVIAVILVIGLAGWLVYDSGLIGGDTISEEESLQNPVEQLPVSSPAVEINAADPEIEQAEASSEPTGAQRVTNDSEVLSQQQNRYGLTGEINESIATGYTIVVHSLNLEKAQTVRERLQTAGFRVMIMDAVVNGGTYYRVGLGQFPTIEAAQQAINKLPQKLQNHYFIKRF